MAIASTTNSLRLLLDQATPAQLAMFLQILRNGDFIRSMPVWLRRCNPSASTTAAANPYIVSGQSLAETVTGSVPSASPGANIWGQLPDTGKSSYILRAVAMTGTATPTTAELTVDSASTNATSFGTAGTGPAAGHIGVSPSGDIVTNTADAWTSVDVLYLPEQVDVVEITMIPATGVVTLPALTNLPNAGATAVPATVLLMEAEILTGTVTGKCAILPLATAAPGATKQASLNLAKTVVNFKVSDAPTLVRLKLGVCRTINGGVNMNQLLEAVSPIF